MLGAAAGVFNLTLEDYLPDGPSLAIRGSSEAHWTESLTGYPRRHAESSVNLAALMAKLTDLHPAELPILMMRVGGQAEGGEGVQPLGRASGRVLFNKALPRSRKGV
ncbi:unnamed protein product [Clonostachys chloroleuca]|uniref:Uncharacterized protein n=1 Tax=Clonostachys chloroleuca TaxID=1926264 RepID=A0AA35MK15_9HYPO|nr:unnamed protein product [Clonostachys chloroleuca]